MPTLDFQVATVVIIGLSCISSVYSGRICLSGTGLVNPTDADQVVECGDHETCYLEQYVTPNGFVQHKTGCKDTKFCGTGSVAAPNIGVCSECCNNDLCAPTLCGNSGWPTGTGPICYNCVNPISDPAQCSTIKTCSRDEVCGVKADGNGYVDECMKPDVCAAHSTTSTCSSCCSTQLCNFNCTQHAIVTVPTTTTTTVATTTPTTKPTPMACMDDGSCTALLQTFQSGGKDICAEVSFKHFCNKTCALCPGMTTTAPTQTTKFDACTLSPCTNGVCTALPTGTFSCACYNGYVGVLCDKTDPCIVSPCKHGTCTSFANGTFACACNQGFAGVQCDTDLGPCSSNPCLHGNCFNNGNTYQCSCLNGYVGDQCDKLDPCQPSPCHNGGLCSLLNNGSFACVCPADYTGHLCEVASGPCTNNPCVHGHCIEVVGNQFVCVCDVDYIGSLCDKVNPCKPSPCNNGTCEVQSGLVHCKCNHGYTGTLCQQEVITCASSPNICHHGHCQNSGNSYTCTCNTGWTGHHCMKQIRDCKDVLDYNHSGGTRSDVELVLLGGHPTNVLCDMRTAGGGWTVIMNRDDGTQNFPDQSYSTYEVGFGDIRSNFWAGLDKMHNLTNDGRRYQLRVELEVANGTVYTATYNDFSIGPPDDYVLYVGQYHGNAGDSLSGHNGFGFTTKEKDHDSNDGTNCGWYLNGAWWFHTCYDSCLTCPYRSPGTDNKDNCRVFSWNTLGYCIALKSAKLMVRPM